jgi:hypothetical protein
VPSEEIAEVAPPAEDGGPEEPQLVTIEAPVVLPEPADDRELADEQKLYARGPEQPDPPDNVSTAPRSYEKADPSAVARPDRDRFYDVDYRSELRAMIDHVVSIEGPVFFDILIDRIARAHGFQRSRETVQKVIRSALGRNRFPTTTEGGREIIWPQGLEPGQKTPYRAGDREHGDVPLPELADLADILRAEGLEDEEDLIRGIQEHFRLGRLAISTRQRFQAAIVPREGVE